MEIKQKTFGFYTVVAAIIVANMPTDPVLANGLTNIKISDISDQSLESYCGMKMGAGTGRIQVKRSDRIVGCGIPVSEQINTNNQINGGGQANASGSYGGTSGNASVYGNGSGGSNNKYRYSIRYRSFRLTDYCREMVDRSTFFNPLTGEGRVFVGDGGYSCYKTVRQ
jgi:hypothetical protein